MYRAIRGLGIDVNRGIKSRKLRRRKDRGLMLEKLEARQLLAANPIINEFLARNDGGLRDGNGRTSDWIEVYNAGDEAIDLAGYRLTDDASEMSKWVFPTRMLEPGGYDVVFASGQDNSSFVDASGNLHTNFTLRRSGEYLALVAPDGVTISEFGSADATYPEQLTNVSYGGAQSLTLIEPSSPASYWVPISDSFDGAWTDPGFDAEGNGFTAATASLGIETQPEARTNFAGLFETELPPQAHGAYVRIEFQVNDASAISDLLMRLNYDDGFIAYLNGVKVAEENAPANNPGWFSTATDARRDSVVFDPVEYSLTEHRDALVDGTNVLGFHLLNNISDKEDMLLIAQLDAGASNLAAVTGEQARVGYMTTPTPGGPNVSNDEVFDGFVTDTQFSVDRGFFDTPFQVEVTTETEGAEIRYTTDGSAPTADHGTVYSGPITISTTTPFRAAAFKQGFLPANVDTQTYIFLNDVPNQGNSPAGYPTEWGLGIGPVLPADYEMDPEITQNPTYRDIMDDALTQVPTVSIVTNIEHLFDPETGIYQYAESSGPQWERPASVELIFPDGTEGFQENAGLRIQGGASRITTRSPKHSFRLLFKSQYGASKLQYPLFKEESAVQEFDTIILRAGFNQSFIHHNTFLGDNRGRAQYVRDQWGKDTQRAMGWNAPHNTYAHLYVNGMYWGLYNPTERPTDDFAASYFGGDKDEYDVYNSGELLDGTSEAWDRMFELLDTDLTVAENYEAFSQIVDIDAYIDYMLMNHYGGNADWDDHNWYATRRRTDDGKWQFYMWDSEFLFIGENDNMTGVFDGPRFPAALLGRLRGGEATGLRSNEEFRVRYADRIQQHFFNDGLLTPQSVIDRWEARSSQITDAIVAESARWGDYRRDVDQSGTPLVLLERDVHWVAERERLLNDYFPVRTGIVVEQYREVGLFPSIDAPVLNQHGGAVTAGFQLAIANPNDSGTVYYTLDGSDPRLPGGGVAPGAVINDGSSIALNSAQLVKARILSGEEWSALTQAEFFLTTPDSPFNLRVTEVNFHPHEANLVPGQGEADVPNSQFEFVELTNISTQQIDVSDVRFSKGIDFTFAVGTTVSPGQHALVVKDRAAFESRYGTGLNIVGEFADGDLSDTGETIELTDGAGNRIQAFSYGLGTALPSRTSGGGATLEAADPQDAMSVRSSSRFGGSPGSENASIASSIVVSEILSHTAPPDVDKIELRNTSNSPVDVGHWYVGNADDQFAYAIPGGTTIPARGYHVIDETQMGFGLNSGRGGELSIVTADASGRPLQFADQVPFGPSALGVSLGRSSGQGGEFLPLSTVTMGSENSGLKYADVVISEVHYNPVDPDGAGIIRANNLEFVELYNQTDSAIDLSGWRLAGGTEYTFGPDTQIDAGKTVLVVGFDPNRGSEKIVFGFHYGVDPSTPVLGPYSDRLDDDGALVRLERPDLPPVEEPDFTPYLVLDGVQYADVSPWPTSPDQGGDSLTRVSGSTLGEFPASWTARSPSPGTVDFVLRLAGDANEDGRFNQADIVAVLQAGKFLTGQPATWTEGDWTGDGLFNQLDIVAALQTGAYLQGAQAATTVDAVLRDGA